MNPFSEILNGKNPKRPPVWFMRQAGRILPEYQQLRQQFSFRELMETPQLACDVTLMPVNLLDTDAAILFSDRVVNDFAQAMACPGLALHPAAWSR